MTVHGDTPVDLLDRQAGILRAMAPQRKLDAIRDQCRFVIELAEAGVRSRHSDWTPLQVRIDVARRWMPSADHARWKAARVAAG